MRTDPSTSPRRWWALVFLALGLAMIVLDGSIVSVALPEIIRELSLDLTDAQWVTGLYAVVFSALLLTAGQLGDRWGRRRIIIGSCAAYGIISLLAAAATSIPQLVLCRFLIGIGIGAVLPNALALAGELAPPRLLASATGMIGIGITFGGTIAGAVAATLFRIGHGWQSVFIAGGVMSGYHVYVLSAL